MFVYAKPPAFLTDPFFTRSVSPAVIATLSDPDYQKKIAADPDFPKYAGILEMAQKNLKRLADAGIPYGMGTDTGPPGTFSGFLRALGDGTDGGCGVDPIPGDQGSHQRAAAEFLRAKDLGTLEVGKWADMIVLAADPRVNIRNMRTIEAVYIAGNQVDR